MGNTAREAKFIVAGGAACGKTVAFGRLKADEPRGKLRWFASQGMIRMVAGKGRLGLAMLAASFCLTACEPQPKVRTTGVVIPAALKQETLDYLVARGLVKFCAGPLKLNGSEREALANRVDAVFTQQGVPMRFFRGDDVVSREELRVYATAYMKKHGIGDQDHAATCAAGENEIAGQTAIGKYLVRRG